MGRKNPIGIKFIGWFQVLGALAVLLTLNIKQDVAFNVRFALPFIPEIIVQLTLVTFSLIISYGYLKQTKLGYWSMLIYSIAFCCVSLIQVLNYSTQPFIGNFLYAGFVAIYTLLNAKHFNKPIAIKQQSN